VTSAAGGLLGALKPPFPVSIGSPMKYTAAIRAVSTMHATKILLLFTRGFAGALCFPGDKNSTSSTVPDDTCPGDA